jgi:hypothetical protein
MKTSFASQQFVYDNALPADDSLRQEFIERRTEELKKDLWQDLECVTDAVNDAAIRIGYYRRKGFKVHPQAVTWLTLLRDGSDDLELARMLRAAANEYLCQLASDMAEEEAS